VYAAATTVIFRGVSFAKNVALKGNGGAVAGVSTDDGDFSTNMCSVTFTGNRAAAPAASNLWFKVEDPSMNQMSLTFCNTATAGSLLPAAGTATVNDFKRT
jgi:predicted outer membrane repeat protein